MALRSISSRPEWHDYRNSILSFLPWPLSHDRAINHHADLIHLILHRSSSRRCQPPAGLARKLQAMVVHRFRSGPRLNHSAIPLRRIPARLAPNPRLWRPCLPRPSDKRGHAEERWRRLVGAPDPAVHLRESRVPRQLLPHGDYLGPAGLQGSADVGRGRGVFGKARENKCRGGEVKDRVAN
ncbi:hypothetical protein PG993_006243 [Apiospora rasikravindrae]|uniref:Uncharacterized protein n=1 Tax=Apiospora rasikravindrae TaxID=990691 RepID=A0ABR1T6Y9_9PEZI